MHKLALSLGAVFVVPILLILNTILPYVYAETSTMVVMGAHSNPLFAFDLRALSSPTGVSGSGNGIVTGQSSTGIYPQLTFTYSINTMSISPTTNGVNGKPGTTVYLTATVTSSTDTNKVPIGSTFYITGNDPCCAIDPSLARSNSNLVIVSFQGPLGGVYTLGAVNIIGKA
jgi:hypothetical protein